MVLHNLLNMVNIETLLIKRIMLLSHERGIEMSIEEVLERADNLSGFLRSRGLKPERINAFELMIELLSTQWK